MARSYEFYVTAGINAAIEQNIRFAREVFCATTRYTACDWGDLCESDKAMNEQALQRGGRILGIHHKPWSDVHHHRRYHSGEARNNSALCG